MDYPQALAYLDRHVNLEARAGRIEGLSLDKVERLMAVLGEPQRSYPVIHVTGTNGKGSVARITSALLQEHGLSVGTYTSPHLERVNERLAWDLEPISDEDFARVMTEVADLVPLAGVEPSYFELLTAAALSWFAEIAVDVAVLEVGMLGRFDATNVADAAVAVITNIGRDHTDGQGDWRAAIAAEKAGVVKPGSVLVLGETDPALRATFEAEGPAATFVEGEDFHVERDRLAVGGRLLDVHTPASELTDLVLPLHGRHQAHNALLSIAAVEAFFGRALDEEVVRAGLAAVTVPGRFEVVHRNPLVVVDGAHNPDGAAAAAATLAEDFDVAGQRILVVGMLRGEGREPRDLLEALDAGHADLVVTCTAPSPRAVPASELAAVARELGAEAEAAADVADALERALAVAGEDDAILVTGTLFVLAPARAIGCA